VKCARCYSYAINEHLHGRTPGRHSNLCDVCYWRAEYENRRAATASRTLFIFDVESIGLHGEGFAVAGGVFRDGEQLTKFLFACDPRRAEGRPEDHQWVAQNVPPLTATHDYPHQVRAAFVEEWLSSEAAVPGLAMAAECGWPVEANFLLACAREHPGFQPYPVHEIASVFLAAGMDPLATYPRLPDELPVHHPMADARQSARLMFEAMSMVRS